MLNKELLLSGPQEDEWHFEITVGNSESFFGYGLGEVGRYGSINRIPYFKDAKYKLNEVSYDDGFDFTQISTNPLGSFVCNIGDVCPTVTVTDDMGHFQSFTNDREGMYLSTRGDVFALKDSYGQTRKFKIDPPPTGYLDPVTLQSI